MRLGRMGLGEMAKFRAVFFDLDGTLWDQVACSDYVMEIVLPKLMPHLPDEDEADVVLRFNVALIDLVRSFGLTERRALTPRARFEQLLESYDLHRDKEGSRLLNG